MFLVHILMLYLAGSPIPESFADALSHDLVFRDDDDDVDGDHRRSVKFFMCVLKSFLILRIQKYKKP